MNSQNSISDKDNDENCPPILPNTNAQRPSEGWLRNPAWIGKYSLLNFHTSWL